MTVTIVMPKSLVQRFEKEHWPKVKDSQRYGQAFYDFAQMSKVPGEENVTWLDKLYNANDAVARVMILSIIDDQN